ncbi:MAG: M23 family metallopeptidase [Clostridia bacterium]
MKKLFVHIRTSIKFILLVAIGLFLIIGVVSFVYKPIYKVEVNGQTIGYSQDKAKLQKKINDYVKNGDGENIAFVEIEEMPEYKLCLLKKGIVPNDDEIYKKVTEAGTPYYKYFAIIDDDEEKAYVSNYDEAETIVEQLKEKNSANKDDIRLLEKYETELKEFSSVEEVVANLYEKPKPVIQKSVKVASTGSQGFSTSRVMSNQKVNLGVSLIKPITGTITSRFGNKSGIRSGAHTGLDIGAPYGTSIKAAASGTVIFAGYKGSYGNLIIVSHGNGVQTYYGHCSSLVASVGQQVSQGQVIAKVGSTGNSTGNHLHLEIRVNGVAQNPQNYLY